MDYFLPVALPNEKHPKKSNIKSKISIGLMPSHYLFHTTDEDKETPTSLAKTQASVSGGTKYYLHISADLMS